MIDRENDVTFSLGRVTDHDEVLHLLWVSGCVKDADRVTDDVKQLTITKALNNGQVFMTTVQDGVADDWVARLHRLKHPDLRNCHSYTGKQIPVRMGNIHPTDPQMHVIFSKLF